MALLESCCGCSLAISSAVLGVYLLVAYIIAFMIELWWILDPSVTAPVAAYLLCLGYFVLFAFSSVLLHGLSIKRTTFLLLWLFMMGILLGPEAGLVLYMSIHYWRITSVNGLIEITCWACRLLVNAAGILCVQSLHSTWREEKSVLLRLEALKSQTPMHKVASPVDNRSVKSTRVPSMIKGYSNHGYSGDEDKYIPAKCPETKAGEISISGEDGGEGHLVTEEGEVFQISDYPNSYFPSDFNEFNASSFDPSVIDARLPYLTIRQKPKMMNPDPSEKFDLVDFAETGKKYQIMPKTHSLIDLSVDDMKNVEVVKFPSYRLSPPLGKFGYPKESRDEGDDDDDDDDDGDDEPDSEKREDAKIIKNKNLKILKRFSPFFRKKSNEMINIYRINPPKGRLAKDKNSDLSNLDSRLNQIYRTRGMYAFEEKTRKIIFYPPEFFYESHGPGFRGPRLSSTSSLSQSSVDSEDIKQISDVAL